MQKKILSPPGMWGDKSHRTEERQFSVTVFPKNMVVGINAAFSNTETTPSHDRQLHYQTISESINSNPLLQAMRSGKIVHRGLQETALKWILSSPRDAFTIHGMK